MRQPSVFFLFYNSVAILPLTGVPVADFIELARRLSYRSRECVVLATRTDVQNSIVYFCFNIALRFTLPRFLLFVNILIS